MNDTEFLKGAAHGTLFVLHGLGAAGFLREEEKTVETWGVIGFHVAAMAVDAYSAYRHLLEE